ncbi:MULTISPECIES: hypothetical protein [Roseomonadaceae]|uniref:Uncharacterized protein n=1 Tax=Falsiroseomonas oleicola TaxID=2801474 RepID=A0ABS6HB69_9PROT|nr:hypothetical protein [Roseomonas oleicola]MBU8545964.1 hypothetical protein [Roseomonas oleicola]
MFGRLILVFGIGFLGLAAFRAVFTDSGSCLVREASRFDANNFDWRNGCSREIHVVVCSRQNATDLLAAIMGRSGERCEQRVVQAGGHIASFYGSDENSSLLRSAVANSHVRVAYCNPPKWPNFEADGRASCL